MNLKKAHRVLGLTLTIPLITWALTGIVFLIKPGYEGAYQQLTVKTYPLEQSIRFTPKGNWHQARTQRTILGNHLLLSNGKEQLHLKAATLENYPEPSQDDIRALIQDAMTINPARYGNVMKLTANRVLTDTGVEIELDWPTLSLQQRGRDTKVINTLYSIHYLQWLGSPLLNNILGALGVLLLLVLVIFGLLNFRHKENSE